MRTPRCAVSQDALLVWAKHTEVCQHCSLDWSSGLFLEENSSVHSFCHERNGLLHKNLQVHFKAKTGSHKWCNQQYQMWAACSFLCYNLTLSCSQEKVTQHRPEAVLSMQCSTGQHSLLRGSLTPPCVIVFWVASLHLPFAILCSLGCFQPLLWNRSLSSKSRRSINCSWSTVYALWPSPKRMLSCHLRFVLSVCEMLNKYL